MYYPSDKFNIAKDIYQQIIFYNYYIVTPTPSPSQLRNILSVILIANRLLCFIKTHFQTQCIFVVSFLPSNFILLQVESSFADHCLKGVIFPLYVSDAFAKNYMAMPVRINFASPHLGHPSTFLFYTIIMLFCPDESWCN